MAAGTSPTITASLEADNTSPTVAIEAYAPDPTNQTTVVYEGTASDSGAGIIHVLVRGSMGSAWTTATLTGAGDWEATIAGLSEGLHEIQARATDGVGRVSSLSTDSLTVDTIAPAVSILDPQTSATLSDDITIEARVTDGVSGVDTGSVEYRFDQPDEVWTTMTLVVGDATSGTYEATINTETLLDGRWRWRCARPISRATTIRPRPPIPIRTLST